MSVRAPLLQLESASLADDNLADLRFRRLLTDAEWAHLPPAVRCRFSKRLAEGQTVFYCGQVTAITMNRAGIVLTRLARIIGGPLPLSLDEGCVSLVAVTEDRRQGGQVWTRLYVRSNGFPQVIHSAKRFCGPTGLEEHVGCGIGMTLAVSVESGVLRFESQRYFLALGDRRLTLPRWLTPGALLVTHREIDATHFVFTLDIRHPLFGSLLHQSATYSEVSS
jgi:hypothetical protein